MGKVADLLQHKLGVFYGESCRLTSTNIRGFYGGVAELLQQKLGDFFGKGYRLTST